MELDLLENSILREVHRFADLKSMQTTNCASEDIKTRRIKNLNWGLSFQRILTDFSASNFDGLCVSSYKLGQFISVILYLLSSGFNVGQHS